MQMLRIGGLPGAPGAAAEQFYREAKMPVVEDTVLVLPPADYSHRSWRLASVQSLARKHAPLRINAIASRDEAAIAAALAFLAGAEGVTGQYFVLDGIGAGDVIA